MYFNYFCLNPLYIYSYILCVDECLINFSQENKNSKEIHANSPLMLDFIFYIINYLLNAYTIFKAPPYGMKIGNKGIIYL